jgi:rubrerythrin
MFLIEILERCGKLEQRLADIYGQFAEQLKEDKDIKSFWLGMAEEEKHHARILAAEKAALEVDSDPGYFMPEFSAKLVAMDTLLKGIEKKAQAGVTKEEAFSLALELERSELQTVYHDLVLMGRVAVKLMARSVDESLSLSRHQQELLDGISRFVTEGPVREQAEAWRTQQSPYYQRRR